MPCYSRVLQYSQHIATERSFSRLPTHPYAQWWNVTFITINNSSFLPFSVSVYTVILESVEEWSPKDLPLFPFLGQYNMPVYSRLPLHFSESLMTVFTYAPVLRCCLRLLKVELPLAQDWLFLIRMCHKCEGLKYIRLQLLD